MGSGAKHTDPGMVLIHKLNDVNKNLKAQSAITHVKQVTNQRYQNRIAKQNNMDEKKAFADSAVAANPKVVKNIQGYIADLSDAKNPGMKMMHDVQKELNKINAQLLPEGTKFAQDTTHAFENIVPPMTVKLSDPGFQYIGQAAQKYHHLNDEVNHDVKPKTIATAQQVADAIVQQTKKVDTGIAANPGMQAIQKAQEIQPQTVPVAPVLILLV